MMQPDTRQGDYVSVVYNEKDKPFTQYPYLLTRYLTSRYRFSKGLKILDLGCGRGEFLRGFISNGLEGYGVDNSLAAKAICPEAEIRKSDIENAPLPYADNTFEVVFSKSVLEHLYHPEKLVKEINRILTPGGIVITMVPDWESMYKTFYHDYTHRTPFTFVSLKRIFTIYGFEKVDVEKFRQLPFLWTMPFLQPFSKLVALLIPMKFSQYSKLVRFSKEVMLLASAVKPKN